ncbi:MAG: NUDIX domain-containing protein [Patescibacteria group bacterium]
MNLQKVFSAGAIIYTRTKEGPKFLILYHGGRYWNFAKGTVEAGEGSYDTALREISEETGLRGHDLRFNQNFKVYDNFTFSVNRQKILKTVIYFLAEAKGNHVKISKEHQGYGWFLYKDAIRMLIYDNLKNNLKKAYEVIQRKSVRNDKKNTSR